MQDRRLMLVNYSAVASETAERIIIVPTEETRNKIHFSKDA